MNAFDEWRFAVWADFLAYVLGPVRFSDGVFLLGMGVFMTGFAAGFRLHAVEAGFSSRHDVRRLGYEPEAGAFEKSLHRIFFWTVCVLAPLMLIVPDSWIQPAANSPMPRAVHLFAVGSGIAALEAYLVGMIIAALYEYAFFRKILANSGRADMFWANFAAAAALIGPVALLLFLAAAPWLAVVNAIAAVDSGARTFFEARSGVLHAHQCVLAALVPVYVAFGRPQLLWKYFLLNLSFVPVAKFARKWRFGGGASGGAGGGGAF